MKPTRVLQQVEANCRAVFDHYGLPQLAVVANMSDRVIFHSLSIFIDRVRELPIFVPCSYAGHGLTADQGWRETVDWHAMQIVHHVTELIEVDFDICNPVRGLAPAFGHLWEVLIPGKTDPFRIARGLRKRGIAVSIIE